MVPNTVRDWIGRKWKEFTRAAPQHPLLVVPVSLFAFAAGCTLWVGLRTVGDPLVAVSGIVQGALIAYVAYIAARMQMRLPLIDRANKQRDVRHVLDRNLKRTASAGRSVLQFLENSLGWTKNDATAAKVVSNIRDCKLARFEVGGTDVLEQQEIDDYHNINDSIEEILDLIIAMGKPSPMPDNTTWRDTLLTRSIADVVALIQSAVDAHERCKEFLKPNLSDKMPVIKLPQEDDFY